MGFLDNSSITVDAILTKRGREVLAAGGDLNITKFALSDEEIDYTLYDVTHPNGTDSYGTVIENMSLLEATPNRTAFRSFLVNQSQAGAQLNIDSTNYSNVTKDTDIVLKPKTVGSPTENYIFTIGNTNIVKFNGGTSKTFVGPQATLIAQSINTLATTDVTIQGKTSGLVQTITISVKEDAGSGKDPLSKQPRNNPLDPESGAPINFGPGGSISY